MVANMKAASMERRGIMEISRCVVCNRIATNEIGEDAYCEDCYEVETYIDRAADAYLSGIDDHEGY